MTEAWDRVVDVWTTVSPAPLAWQWTAGIIAFAVALLMPHNWWVGLLRPWITLLHETGHAVGALITGRRVVGLSVHGDTSGLTTTYGRPGPTAQISRFAGYPVPAWAAIGAVLATAAGRYGALFLAAGIVGALLLLAARTWRAALGLIALMVPAGVLLWHGPSTVAPQLLDVIPLILLVLSGATIGGAARALWEERRARRRGAATDVATLPGGSRIAGTGWWLLMWATIIGPLLLLPDVYAQAQ